MLPHTPHQQLLHFVAIISTIFSYSLYLDTHIQRSQAINVPLRDSYPIIQFLLIFSYPHVIPNLSDFFFFIFRYESV